MPRRNMSYAGFAPSDQPYEVAGRPWGMPATTMPPGQTGPYQGQGDWGTDPFGYTGGSLLTPWTQAFQPPGGGRGGVAAPDLKAWSYGDFGYNFTAPGGYTASQFTAPGRFTYMDFDAPEAFKAPGEADVKADPGYRARMEGGTDAIMRQQAATGNIRGGGTLRGLMEYGQRLGSEEYDKAYGRRASEYDRRYSQARDVYGMNRQNAAENYDRNFQTQHSVHRGNEADRRAAYEASSDVALRGGELGYNIASGVYDRNRQNAMDTWQSEQEMARASAAAANAGSERDYNRALNEYQMAYDIYRTNQNDQWGRLSAMTNLGYGAAGNQAAYAGQYGGTMADLYTGGANARAAGTIGGANAWNTALGSIGNTAMDLYAYNRMYPSTGRSRLPPVYQGPIRTRPGGR